MLFDRSGRTFKEVVTILDEYRANLGENAAAVSGEDGEDGISQREVVSALIEYLEG